MSREILRIEGMFGRGVFSLMGDALVERFPHMLDLVPAEDPAINSFMDDIEERASRYSFLDTLRHAFGAASDPAYHRAQKQNWMFGFTDYKQLRSMFFENESIEMVKRHGLRLNKYRVAEDDMCAGRGQVLFFKPAAEKIAQLSLDTGAEIEPPPEPLALRAIRRALSTSGFTPRSGP